MQSTIFKLETTLMLEVKAKYIQSSKKDGLTNQKGTKLVLLAELQVRYSILHSCCCSQLLATCCFDKWEAAAY